MNDALLEARALCCERDDRILFSDLGLKLSHGEIVQVEGRNGAGKSTLLKILCGLFSEFEGEVLYSGSPISMRKDEYYADLCYVGHRLPVKGLLTAKENLRYYSALSGNWSPMLMEEAFSQLGLKGYEDTLCSELSAGQQRRVALSRLWLSHASIWMLDEPFTALDIETVCLLESFFEFAVSKGKLVVFTSHHAPKISGLRAIDLAKSGTGL